MKRYLITSPEFYTQEVETFQDKLRQQIKIHMPEFVLYRDKENSSYERIACGFIEVVREFEALKAFIHSDYKLAKNFKADGVHLTSTQFDAIDFAKEAGLEVIISTHTHDEVLQAERLGADYVTYSPIFATPDKGEPKGVEDLKALLKKTDMKIFALGGIVEKRHVKMMSQSGVYGFASIRYFETR